ncbi:MAG: hypothetical protein M3Y22_05745 [Pseudomonadota bacterium]|nr:hypothetical protein [Pseudomonadota bacterium]
MSRLPRRKIAVAFPGVEPRVEVLAGASLSRSQLGASDGEHCRFPPVARGTPASVSGAEGLVVRDGNAMRHI